MFEKEGAGTSALNQTYDKLQAKQDKAQIRKLVELARCNIHGQINNLHLIMIISTSTQNISDKFWTYYFVAVNLHPHHHMNFTDWIKKILPAVKTGKTAYF